MSVSLMFLFLLLVLLSLHLPHASLFLSLHVCLSLMAWTDFRRGWAGPGPAGWALLLSHFLVSLWEGSSSRSLAAPEGWPVVKMQDSQALPRPLVTPLPLFPAGSRKENEG